jgi:hypothetical protein
MYGLVDLLMRWLTGNTWSLVLGITVGVLTYSAWILLSWFVAGKPEGLESTVLEFLTCGKRN